MIERNDLTSYTTFAEILMSNSIAGVKSLEKELEKQVKKIYEDEEWLVIRPLTHLSSVKYGASTKWCTTSKNTPRTFVDYTKNGILVYCIGKKTGLKVAAHKLMDDGYVEISFWNQLDERIDSIMSDLPFDILLQIRKELETDVPNSFYLTKEMKESEELTYKSRRRNLGDAGIKMKDSISSDEEEEFIEKVDYDGSDDKDCCSSGETEQDPSYNDVDSERPSISEEIDDSVDTLSENDNAGIAVSGIAVSFESVNVATRETPRR